MIVRNCSVYERRRRRGRKGDENFQKRILYKFGLLNTTLCCCIFCGGDVLQGLIVNGIYGRTISIKVEIKSQKAFEYRFSQDHSPSICFLLADTFLCMSQLILIIQICLEFQSNPNNLIKAISLKRRQIMCISFVKTKM